MKKFQLILIAAFAFLTIFTTKTANAQVSYGARAGVNFATEPVEGLYHVFLARPYVGLFGQYNIDAVGIHVGANYSGEGANYKDLETNDVYHVRHAFLTIPVLVQYKFGFGGYIEAGPQIGFLLSASEQDNSTPSIDTKAYYKGTDVSAGLGFGYDFNKSANGLGLSFRYMRGLTSFNKVDVDNHDNIKSRVLSVGLTYKIYNKK